MTDVAQENQSQRKLDKIARRQVDKFDARRTELAVATLHTLAELGYARTSLREIAQNSEFSHGVLHYYFTDKRDLIIEAVRQYERVCVTKYDEVVAHATSAQQLCDEFVAMFFDTLVQDATLHRLWYDLRNQSLYEEYFRADVLEIDGHREDMVWRVVSRYAELRDGTPAASPGTAYVTLDGIFQRALLHHLAGNTETIAALRAELPGVIDLLVTSA
ncbi:TetR/AcrR family transcriptional regulator [Lentzea sp. NPDC005914]|uniref:TetR/AcrR family transcriptional regulator n=1 Tax=Lentzea sp. NPDC005914 TaxID=3154572 RepID=UPI00340CAC5D